MLDVCACVIVEEEKERKGRGNLCAQVREIMVWRNPGVCIGHETRVLVLYCMYRAGPVRGSAV